MGDKLTTIYGALLAHYGDLRWWPAKSEETQLRSYEIMVGAVLTQNTAWSNVEKVIANFDGRLTPEFVAVVDLGELIDIIRPAGFFNQKTLYLKALTVWFAEYDYDVAAVQKEELSKIRTDLLRVKGVGKETADSILLYAFGFPTFVVDAYTMRLCERIPIKAGKDYDAVKAYFERHLPKSAEVYNHYHALIVENAKQHCRKKPQCDGCPIFEVCGRCG